MIPFGMFTSAHHFIANVARPISVALLVIFGVTVSGQVKTITVPFPQYEVIAGSMGPGGDVFSSSPAKMCLTEKPDDCYAPRARDDEYEYGQEPKAKVIPSFREQWLLFQAHGGGGSGFAYHVALLRYRPNEATHFENLLSQDEFSNLDDWGVVSAPTVSRFPLFAVAECEWTGVESHYAPHQYDVIAYRFDHQTSRYRKLTHYETKRKYESTDDARGDVLRFEHRNIMRLLRRFSKRHSPHCYP